jgi:hypothetical protein
MRKFLFLLFLMCLLVWTLVGLLFTMQQNKVLAALPTSIVFVSFTPSITPTVSSTSTPSITPTPTLSPTSTFTLTATPSATLSQRVLQVAAIMPDVHLPPTPTELPFGTILLPALPQPVEPLPDATNQLPPYNGWYSFESDHPKVSYASLWDARQIVYASRGQYHRTEDRSGVVSFPFEGEGVRVRYVAARNMGMFDLFIDGKKVDTIDGYSGELIFPGTSIYMVSKGSHLLQIQSAGMKNAQSEGYAVGLDAIQVFQGSPNTLILTPPPVSLTPPPSPQPVAKVELITVPPTTQPLEQEAEAVSVNLVIAYDENGNKAVDPAEGVRDIPVRVVHSKTNRVISEYFTDSSGYIGIEIQIDAPTRLVVPYFGKVWELPRGRQDNTASFTLLLTPGNQPGLIP